MKSFKGKKPRWNRIIILFLMIFLLLCCTVQALGAEKGRDCVTVLVESGDTIWDLVGEYNPQFSGDMSEACYEVKEMNHLSTSSIMIGTYILIPVDF